MRNETMQGASAVRRAPRPPKRTRTKQKQVLFDLSVSMRLIERMGKQQALSVSLASAVLSSVFKTMRALLESHGHEMLGCLLRHLSLALSTGECDGTLEWFQQQISVFREEWPSTAFQGLVRARGVECASSYENLDDIEGFQNRFMSEDGQSESNGGVSHGLQASSSQSRMKAYDAHGYQSPDSSRSQVHSTHESAQSANDADHEPSSFRPPSVFLDCDQRGSDVKEEVPPAINDACSTTDSCTTSPPCSPCRRRTMHKSFSDPALEWIASSERQLPVRMFWSAHPSLEDSSAGANQAPEDDQPCTGPLADEEASTAKDNNDYSNAQVSAAAKTERMLASAPHEERSGSPPQQEQSQTQQARAFVICPPTAPPSQHRRPRRLSNASADEEAQRRAGGSRDFDREIKVSANTSFYLPSWSDDSYGQEMAWEASDSENQTPRQRLRKLSAWLAKECGPAYDDQV
eukprot:TRINITY_DN10934_c0_g1_i1.p1 TRINITY_DN10934_c0_g1~~TRINITY_DN10934_c0_g1_i1.p1  ORF type:complete len:462 (-),score=74.59 TRINITY_DN10934_c0_g1_i1:367-1752(-)